MNATFNKADERWDVNILVKQDGTVEGVFIHFIDLLRRMPKIDVVVIDVDEHFEPQIENRSGAISCSSGYATPNFAKMLTKAEGIRMSILSGYLCGKMSEAQLAKIVKGCFKGYDCTEKG